MEEQSVSKILPTLINRWFTDEFIEFFPNIIEHRIQQLINTDSKNIHECISYLCQD